ncbi:MAG: tRNA (adenosine(37)-N6)-threonylcarbamoyltransferase complex ATPase subunit type 1 TsaE [Oscillospiraceae bacterium]|jgi:tRNA threonylcarbamoyladenosine biosynthesis protein TsaE|nr:tRNA (adenosine(37)-N6)-threonylcarbamoyltransferase complex ATPase subunit type 1 TsaE [Oscillospiraceae bacterium]
MREFITASAPETEALGEKIAGHLKAGDVLALFGGMGTGKTTLTRGVARGLGIAEGVSSPTFALVHEYAGRLPIYHFDMYRVESWDDLYSTGFFDYLDSGGILIVEWSEKIENALPENAIRVSLRPGPSENERIITVEGMNP